MWFVCAIVSSNYKSSYVISRSRQIVGWCEPKHTGAVGSGRVYRVWFYFSVLSEATEATRVEPITHKLFIL